MSAPGGVDPGLVDVAALRAWPEINAKLSQAHPTPSQDLYGLKTEPPPSHP